MARNTGADEACAIGMLQQMACLCDDTRRTASSDPSRIAVMLETFEETLATLAPVLERLGASPGASRDTVLAAAHQATASHNSLIEAMALELDRLGRAISESDYAANATHAYASAQQGAAHAGLDISG
jgi:hypothetical protein